MIEVMVSLVILLLGLLGFASLVLVSQRAETEAYQRSQALLLLQDMVGRINANRRVAACYAVTTDLAKGLPFLGNGSTVTPSCGFGSAQANQLASSDLAAWSDLLSGTAETLNGTNLGAMVAARGCISFDIATGFYLVSVAWQGIVTTAPPGTAITCGKDLYGNESMRRVASMTVQITNLN